MGRGRGYGCKSGRFIARRLDTAWRGLASNDGPPMPWVFERWVGLTIANDEHHAGRVVALRRARIAKSVRAIFRKPEGSS